MFQIRRILARFVPFLFLIIVVLVSSCGNPAEEVKQFDFLVGKWERIVYNFPAKKHSTLTCKLTENNEIVCTSEVTILRDSSRYNVNYYVKKEGSDWVFEIEEMAIVRYPRVFPLEEPRKTTYFIQSIDSTKFTGQKDSSSRSVKALTVSNYEENRLMILSSGTPHVHNPFHYKRVE